MDFVDLDKVLDQFEEEEKAAGELQPGQEIRPSGYAEYLATHQDQPWERLICPPTANLAGKLQSSEMPSVAYDDPYDVVDSQQVKQKHCVYGHRPGSPEQELDLEAELEQVRLKQRVIESFLPKMNTVISNGYGLEESSPDRAKRQESTDNRFASGLIASQPASIQTDVLSPVSEQELLSSPLPKSAITVVGHGDQDTSPDSPCVESGLVNEAIPHGQNDFQPTWDDVSSTNINSVHIKTGSDIQISDSIYVETDEKNINQVETLRMASIRSDQCLPADDGFKPLNAEAMTCSMLGANLKALSNSSAEEMDSRDSLDSGCEDFMEASSPVCRNKSNEFSISLPILETNTSAKDGPILRVETPVGFNTETSEMDTEELEAYLKELEEETVLENSENHTKQQACEGKAEGDSMPSAQGHSSDLPRLTQENITLPDTVVGSEEAQRVSSENITRPLSNSIDDLNIFKNFNGSPSDQLSMGKFELDAVTNACSLSRDISSIESVHAGSNKLINSVDNNILVGDRSETSILANNHFVENKADPGRSIDKQPFIFSKSETSAIVHQNLQNSGFKLTEHNCLHEVGREPGTVSQLSIKPNFNLDFVLPTGSLEFPTITNNNDLTTVVKGKLEIETLLDDILSSKLSQKLTDKTANCPQLVNSPDNVERRMKINNSEQESVTGRVAESSVKSSLAREGPSQSPDTVIPAGSPSPTLGIGARPKDPSQMKKNRPNSLLGLSKISLNSPFSPPQGSSLASSGYGLTHTGLEPDRLAESEVSGLEVQNTVSRLSGDSPAPDNMGKTSLDEMTGLYKVGTKENGDLETLGYGIAYEDDADGSTVTQRPQSWSPDRGSSPSGLRMKRPTSLNLPVRQGGVASGSPDSEDLHLAKTDLTPQTIPADEAAASEKERSEMGVVDSPSESDATVITRGQELSEAESPFPSSASHSSILLNNLGKMAPTWVPDADAPACMQCASRFTFTKRRHHCRACGKVFCSTCCGQKSRLAYLDNKEGRICVSCHHVLSSGDLMSPPGVACRSPNPNNPIEYCSTVPPSQQANARAPLPTVMVPTGVLKRQGSNRRSEPKQVMFSDGIRPGGDLTELDGPDQNRVPPRRSSRTQKKVEKQQGEHSSAKTRRLRGNDENRAPCLIPETGLPPVVIGTDSTGEVSLSENIDTASLMAQIRSAEASPVTFAVSLNLFVLVKIIYLDCCVNREVWCFTTRGMVTAGQEELVLVLETLPDEKTIPRDIFCHFNTVYEEAGQGNTVSHMGHSIFSQPFLESRDYGGMLYIRATFQCTSKLVLPEPPFLFAILLQKWETPWAKVFPVRLMLRLGAEFRYYPCPLVSIRSRKSVFCEIGHTVMNLLADFRNFQYMLQQIRGVTIHMEDKRTTISFPRNRYKEVMKVVGSSNEHVMALGASFSTEADSHLVCIQNEEGNYQTQAINIQNKPRQVTGASFVVFNGALKSSSGMRAKSSIVEDGLMVQIMPETMAALKQSLKEMLDFTIPCGSLSLEQPEEVVTVRWVDDDNNINIGVRSPVDGLAMDGVESVQVHNAADYVGEHLAIRWTQVFFLRPETGTSHWEPVDLSRVAETLATATCVALTPNLQKLREAGLNKLGLRVTLQLDNVGYEVGSNGVRLPDVYMNDLDNALIPVIHGALTHSSDGPIVLELVFHIIH